MATPNVVFALSDFTVEAAGAGYPVQLSPNPSLFALTDESGEVTFSSVTPGSYTLNAPGSGIPALRITVPDEAGPLDAIDLVNEGQGWVAPGGTPEGRIAAPPQSRYYDPVNGRDYVKATGTGNTGWLELVGLLLLMLWTVGVQAADPRVRGTAVVPRSAIESTAYDATSWNGNTNSATKDAIRDKVETLAVGASVWTNSAGIVTLVDTNQIVRLQRGTSGQVLSLVGAAAQNAVILDIDHGNTGTGDCIQVRGNSPDGTSSPTVFELFNQGGVYLYSENNQGTPILYVDGSGLEASAPILEVYDGENELALQIGYTGGLSLKKTITAGGTTGTQTINKAIGSVNFAIGAQTLVVTNSFASATSVILATVATDDATALNVKAIPQSGQFTLKLNATATAETRVNWLLSN